MSNQHITEAAIKFTGLEDHPKRELGKSVISLSTKIHVVTLSSLSLSPFVKVVRVDLSLFGVPTCELLADVSLRTSPTHT